MVKLCIIENDNLKKTKLITYIDKTIKDNNLEMEVEFNTSNVKEFMYNIEWDESTRVYFIDIDLGDYINGIDLAEFIRKYDKNGYIVFVTSFGDFNQFIMEYKIKTFAIIEKNNDIEIQEGVRDCLLDINKKSISAKSDKERLFRIKYGNSEIELELDEIMFFESTKNHGKIIIHGFNRQIELSGYIKDIQEIISEEFTLVNKTLLINSRNINVVDNENTFLIMSNGERVFIGNARTDKLIKNQGLVLKGLL